MQRWGFVGILAFVSACQGSTGTATRTTTGQNAVTVTARGPSTPVARAAATAPDAAPTLVTLRARGAGGGNVAVRTAPPIPSVPAAPTPTGAVPASGGYIVRGAGSATGGSPPSGVVAMAPSDDGDRGGGEGVRRRASDERAGGGRGHTGSMGSAPAMEPMRPATVTAAPYAGGGGYGGVAHGGDSHRATTRATGNRAMESSVDDMAAPSPPMQRAPMGRTSPPASTGAAYPGAVGGAVAAPSPYRPMPTPMPVTPPTTVTVTITAPPPPPVIVAPVMVQENQEPEALLTAASVGDTDRRDNYLSFLARHVEEAMSLGLDMTRRVRFRVIDAQGRGVNDARITLGGEGLQMVAHTHGDGTWDFFPGISAPGYAGRATARIDVENLGVQAVVDVPPAGDGPDVTVQLPAVVQPPTPSLDLGFLIDVTGSMGDELRYVNREIGHIVQRIEAEAPGTRVRVSATFYRDRVDQMIVQQIPFTTNVLGFASTMRQVNASGGGDYPEDMNAGLEAALTGLAWSEGPAVRVLIVVADAPPQHYADENFTWQSAMNDASRRGIRILPVGASGSNREVEFLFRAMGTMTSTPYVYLTDESGIGAPHMEADTDRVAVERFNDLLTRLVVSDLRGQGMHEPVPPGV